MDLHIDCPNVLYKYVVPERVDILKNLKIRFTQPKALNDPFDLRPMFDQIASEEFVLERLRADPRQREVELEKALYLEYQKLPAESRAQRTFDEVKAFVKDNPQMLEAARAKILPVMLQALRESAPKLKEMFINKLQEKIGILSLSENGYEPMMWAHYAAGYKGFVLEFNTRDKFFNQRRSVNDELYYLRKVHYQDETNTGATLIDLGSEAVFLTKRASWTYEKEWRMLVPLEKAVEVLSVEEDEIYLFDLPASALQKIIVGNKTKPGVIAELKNLTASNTNLSHVKLVSSELDFNTGQIKEGKPI